MIGAFAIMMVFGGLFNVIGNNLPIVKTFLGGGAIVCIFASATMVYLGAIPEVIVENVDNFMNTTGFLNFYIAALITGSILGMNRSLLLKAAVRFLPVALCAMTVAILAVGCVGALVGYGFVEAIMYVAIPMMGGGMGAGVVPLSGMYAEALQTDASQMISRMVPASTLGNVMAIIGAGMLAKLGDVKPELSGNGRLMKKMDDSMSDTKKAPLDLQTLGMGLITSIFFFLLGTIINKLVPAVHAYAWMIILVAAGKAIGIAMIDLNAVFQALSPMYLLLVFVVVGGVALGAGIGGHFVGFFPIESAITAGLCTTNMGGTGDIAVLSASKRMELLPFAQIATRICGALVLIVASILIQVLF